jgi:hypothetical protein
MASLDNCDIKLFNEKIYFIHDFIFTLDNVRVKKHMMIPPLDWPILRTVVPPPWNESHTRRLDGPTTPPTLLDSFASLVKGFLCDAIKNA